MPSMPGYFLGKGYQFKMLDEQFGGDEASLTAAYDAALSRIDQPLSQLAENHATSGSGVIDELKQGDVSHFDRHWLGDWWPGKRVEEVLRAGYREAIQRAKDARKPIESLWVCADEDRFQVYICEGPRQITVIVFTPPPKERAHEPVDTLTEDEPIWVVKVHDQDDEDVKAKVRVVVPDDKAPIIVHQLKYRPNQPD